MAYEGGRCLTDREIDLYVDGKMSGEEFLAAEKHIHSCRKCFKEWTDVIEAKQENVIGPNSDEF